MSLSTAIGASIDRVFGACPRLSVFSRLKSSGEILRRYFLETSQAQQEILFYRDKWWTKDGGRLYVEVSCLVPQVQLALTGQPQSLSEPDYAVPFRHFQFAAGEPEQERSWQLAGPTDVARFECAIDEWLHSSALPWLARFESLGGCISYMREHQQFHALALLLSSQGDASGAREALVSWLGSKPRNIEKSLEELASAGLLSSDDCARLAQASLQRDDHYAEELDRWAGGG